MHSQFLKKLDGLAGPLLIRLLNKPDAHQACSSPRSALFIRPGGIGDAVLLVPTLRALQRAHPSCAVDVLAESRNASVFALAPGIRRVYSYNSPSQIGAALAERYDVVIDTEQWYRLSAVVARLTGARVLIGFATNERKRLFTHTVPYLQQQYEAYSFLSLLEPLGEAQPTSIEVPYLTLPTTAVAAAQRLVVPMAGRPYLTIFPGASVPEKQWGTRNFRELAVSLAARGIGVVVVGGADMRAAGEEIARGGGAVNLAGRGSLVETAAIMGQGRLLVSGDSGLLHIAAGLGTPTVSLFGPSDPRKWSPRGEQHRVFSSESPCAPCSRYGTIPHCAVGATCMASTKPAQVLDAALHLWDGASAKQRAMSSS